MSRPALKMFVLFLSLLLCGTASAAEQEESDTVFQITPRIWLSYLNIVNDEETSTDAIFLPLAGLTATLSPTRNLNLIVSGYYADSIRRLLDGNFGVFPYDVTPPRTSLRSEIDRYAE